MLLTRALYVAKKIRVGYLATADAGTIAAPDTMNAGGASSLALGKLKLSSGDKLAGYNRLRDGSSHSGRGRNKCKDNREELHCDYW